MDSPEPARPYRGRFAPSPTGPLHFGSLVAAVASYVDAKAHGGQWLVRMEDIDQPRCVPGASDDILRTLERYGLEWDEAVVFQSRRTALYETALEELKRRGYAYPCTCSRKAIESGVYRGTCRGRRGAPEGPCAWRVRVENSVVAFEDRLAGLQGQNLAREVGDFAVKRADGWFAYQLAVIVDDADQGITDVVRGADLLDSTPRQIWLQRLLEYETPHYMHVPVAKNAAGEKLSKQTRAPGLRVENAAAE
ncbi:MAG TPA: tRNA glutamyl-Q(34) synthetase GluQRS, partial [Bryobacteraceae bacterium]|nr:tRNA glutamyl-Q(34) synthetase GluQRS [Bryobacteraceae bacterium]